MPAKTDAEKEDAEKSTATCWTKDLKALAALQECELIISFILLLVIYTYSFRL